MSEVTTVLDWAAAGLFIVGAFFSFVAGVGLLVLPDVLSRMHAAAKPQVLGLLLMLSGLALRWQAWEWVPVLVLAWVTQMVTAPVASHLVGRTGYRTKHVRRELLERDDLAAAARRVVVVPEDAPRRPRRPIPTRRRGQAADPGRAAEGPAAARTPED